MLTCLFAGIHPHIADSYEGEKSLKELEELVQKPECVGIGEIGLDYNRNFSAKNRQKELFEKQVSINNIPLFKNYCVFFSFRIYQLSDVLFSA